MSGVAEIEFIRLRAEKEFQDYGTVFTAIVEMNSDGNYENQAFPTKVTIKADSGSTVPMRVYSDNNGEADDSKRPIKYIGFETYRDYNTRTMARILAWIGQQVNDMSEEIEERIRHHVAGY